MPWTEGEALTPTNLNSIGLTSSLLFNVRDSAYGALGNGVADDTAAIQAAITAATRTLDSDGHGGTLFFPTGIYAVSSQLLIPDRITVLGQGPRQSQLKWVGTGNTSVMKIYNAGTFVFSTVLRDFSIDCNSVTGMTGLQLSETQENCILSNLGVFNSKTLAIEFLTSSDLFNQLRLESIHCAPTGGSGISITTAANIRLRNITIDRTGAGVVAGYGIQISGNVWNVLFDCLSLEYVTTGINITGGENIWAFGISAGTAGHAGTDIVKINTGGSNYGMFAIRDHAGFTNIVNDVDRSKTIGGTLDKDLAWVFAGAFAGNLTWFADDSNQNVLRGGLKLAGAITPSTPAGAFQTGQIFQGSGAPNNANGNDGDVYFRTDTPGSANQRLYIRSGGTWTGIV